MSESQAIEAPARPDGGQSFEAALRERREAVYSYLEGWEGIASFRPDHMREAILSYVGRRGKGLRAALLMLSCGAAGGDESHAVPAAAAVEIFHVWTLVHDDIIDRDDLRRGKPTVHALFTQKAESELGLVGEGARHYGASVAILAGDLQQSWSYALLSDLTREGVSSDLVVELTRRMATWLTPRLMEGEMLDVQFSLDREAASGAQILDMLDKKTGALLSYAAWAGARIGGEQSGGDPRVADTLGRFAALCGIAIQLQDDLLGLVGDSVLFGKPIGSDLREGKQTYVVSLALERAMSDECEFLRSVLGNVSASKEQLSRAVGILKSTGAINSALELAQQYISQAITTLDELPPSPQRERLHQWADYLLARAY